MSYIDDLNDAASRAQDAADTAEGASQILFDVANGDSVSTVTTASGEVKTVAKAIADIEASFEGGLFNSTVEEVTLADGQTVVTLTEATTDSMQLYVEGAREFDFDITGTDSFELSESFPAGTRIWVVSSEIYADVTTTLVEDSKGVSRTLTSWVDGVQYTYDTLADAQADEAITVGSRIVILGDEAAFDGGGCKLDVVASGGEISLTASGLTANRVDARQLVCQSMEDLLSIKTHDGLTARMVAYHGFSNSELLGGGVFRFSSSLAKSNHDGGTCISPTVPFTWDDDGEAFLSGAGETFPSGSGCWVRVDTITINPLIFGAKGDGSEDFYPVEASLNAYLGGSANLRYDGCGKKLSVSFGYTWTGFVSYRSIKNLWLEATTSFTDEAVMDFTGEGGTLQGFRIEECNIRGRPGTFGVAYADYLIRMYNTAGVFIERNEFAVAGVCCVRDTTTRAATAVHYIDNRMQGGAIDNDGVVGFWTSGADSKFYHNQTRELSTHYKFDSAGQVMAHNHMYNSTASKGAYAVHSTQEGGARIWNNYIDGMRLLFENCPGGVYISDNHFLYQDTTEWDNLFCIYMSPENSGDTLQNVRVIGNGFTRRAGPIPILMRAANTYATDAFDNVIVRDNTAKDVTLSTTEPVAVVELSNAASGSMVVLDQLITDNGSCLQGAISAAITGSTGQYAEIRVGISGSGVFIQTSRAITGTVRAKMLCNAIGGY